MLLRAIAKENLGSPINSPKRRKQREE